MKRITLILVAVASIGATMFSSCKKSTPQSTLTYVNDTYTPISIAVNGVSKSIAVGSSVSYIADVGTEASVIASTSGTYGLTITWSSTDNFPSSGGDNVSEQLDVDASYFFLEGTNSYTSAVTSLIVNQGGASQTTETVNIPDNGNTYGIGYYFAFSNTVIQATYASGTTLTLYGLAIPNTADASYTADF